MTEPKLTPHMKLALRKSTRTGLVPAGTNESISRGLAARGLAKRCGHQKYRLTPSGFEAARADCQHIFPCVECGVPVFRDWTMPTGMERCDRHRDKKPRKRSHEAGVRSDINYHGGYQE